VALVQVEQSAASQGLQIVAGFRRHRAYFRSMELTPELQTRLKYATEKYLNKKVRHRAMGWTYQIFIVSQVLAYGGNGQDVFVVFRHLEKLYIPLGQPVFAFINELEQDYELLEGGQ